MEPATDVPTVHDDTVTSAQYGSGQLSMRPRIVFHSLTCADTPGGHAVMTLPRDSHSSMVSYVGGGFGMLLRRLIGRPPAHRANPSLSAMGITCCPGLAVALPARRVFPRVDTLDSFSPDSAGSWDRPIFGHALAISGAGAGRRAARVRRAARG